MLSPAQDWHFRGADILYVVRAGYRGANSMHNSNRVLFSRLRDWQQYQPQAACRHLQGNETRECPAAVVSAPRHIACDGLIVAQNCSASLVVAPGPSNAAPGAKFGPWSCSLNGGCKYFG